MYFSHFEITIFVPFSNFHVFGMSPLSWDVIEITRHKIIFYHFTDPSPSSISIINKTNTEITIQWTNIVTCYQIAQFVIYLHRPDNSTDSFIIGKDSVIYTITGLSPGASYGIDMYTEYGNGTNLSRSLEPLTTIFSTGKYYYSLVLFSLYMAID